MNTARCGADRHGGKTLDNGKLGRGPPKNNTNNHSLDTHNLRVDTYKNFNDNLTSAHY